MKAKLTKYKVWNNICIFLFILTPLIAAVLFCLRDGKLIRDIYIPLGGWSDEITYYKQIEGILSHGMPRGYFGYNQSKALCGTLGVWGIIPLIPYIIWGFFFGWNYCSPIYANIFFCMVALLGIYIILRPKKRWMGMISFFWIANQFLNRYVLSGVIEASVTAQLLLVTACGLYLLSDTIRGQQERKFTPKKDNAVLILCTILICFMTLARPYFAVLYLIPLWKAFKDKRKGWIFTLPFIAIAVILLFFLNNRFFCSVYFKNIFTFEKVQEAGIGGIFLQIIKSLIEIARNIWYAMRYKGSGIGWYYLLLGVELAAMFTICIIRKCRHKRIPPMFPITLIGNALILLSIIIMYDLGVGARHILALIVVNAVLLIVEAHFSWGGILAVICLVSILQTGNADAPPYIKDDYAAYMDTLKEEFAKVVTVSDEISYNNVVAMPTADHDMNAPDQGVCTYYGLMFAMPSGVGISLDYEDYYDNPENIKAGYILVHPSGQIRLKLEAIGMHCVFANEELALYAR